MIYAGKISATAFNPAIEKLDTGKKNELKLLRKNNKKARTGAGSYFKFTQYLSGAEQLFSSRHAGSISYP